MKSFFRTPEKKEKYGLIIGDIIIVAAILMGSFVFELALRGRLGNFFDPIARLSTFSKIVATVNLVFLFFCFLGLFCLFYIPLFYVGGLYEIELDFNKKRALVKTVTSLVFGCLLVFAVLHIFGRRLFPLEVWASHLISLCIVIYIWRCLFSKNVHKRKPFRILFSGRDALIDKGKAYLSRNSGSRFFKITECSNNAFLEDASLQAKPISNDCDMIVYPFLSKLSQDEMVSLLKEKFRGRKVCSSFTFYKNITGSFPVFELDPQWLIDHSISVTLLNQVQQRIKRTTDIFLSVIGLLVSLPIMAVTAFLIKLTSEGPIFFSHERLGLNKKPFKLYKFRTMIHNAEQKTGPVWAEKDDPRVTKLGKILRKTRLDELPQFFNILKGDMSLIGPRPIRKFFAEKLSKEFPYYYLRFYVKPGLTGWAQVSGSYGETVEGQLKKLEYELFYIHEYSLLLDGVIILKTIQNVLRAKGQ